MKKLIQAIAVVFVLNLLALLIGAGWLFTSGRVSKERIVEMTKLFHEPVAVEQAALKAEQAALEKEIAEQEKPIPGIPLNADELNMVRVELTQIDRQRLDRMKRDVQNLQETLRKERRLVEEDRLALEKERIAFDLMRKRLAGLEGGKQFKKSLNTLSELKSKDAKSVLSSLLDNKRREEVVTYLSSMDTGVRTGIMTEFIKAGEEELAADLLESIRLRGLESTEPDETT